MDWLSSREIAILVWLAIAFALAMRVAAVRAAGWQVVRAFLDWRILLIFALLALYVGLVVWALAALALWDIGQLKNTLIWFIVVGAATLFRLHQLPEEPRFLSEWLGDNLKLLVIVEFVATFFTFDLWLELLIQPIIVFIVVMLAFAPKEPRYDLLKKVLNGTLATFGFGLVAFAIYKLVTDFGEFAQWSTLEDFYLPIVLSLATLPFFFATHVFMVYERVFSTLRFKIKDPDLRRRAILSALLEFGPRAGLVERWNRYIGTHRPKSVSDLKRAARDVKSAKRRELKPIGVPEERGWSPDLARAYLVAAGMKPSDYHRSYDDTWVASSPYLDLDGGILGNNVAYYLSGDELVVTKLRLVLNVNEPAKAIEAEAAFLAAAHILIAAALPGRMVSIGATELTTSIEHWRITVQRENWQGGIKDGYELVLTVGIPAEQIPEANYETAEALGDD